MATSMNRSCQLEEHQVDNEVVLSAQNLKNYCPQIYPQIKFRWVGHFFITQKAFPLTHRLDLPPKVSLHPVLHIDKLKKHMFSEEFSWEVQPPPSL